MLWIKGGVTSPSKLSSLLKRKTEHYPKFKGPCKLSLRFVLTPDQYTAEHLYGPSLDNFVRAAMSALSETIFSKVPGKNEAVLWLEVIKLKAKNKEAADHIIFLESLPKKVVSLKGADNYYLDPLMKAQEKRSNKEA